MNEKSELNMEFKKLLNFFNLLDSEGRLSLTNTALVVTVVKLAIAPQASITEVGAMFLAIANYALKRNAINSNQEPDESAALSVANEVKSKMEQIQSSVNGLLISAGMKVK